MYKTWLYPNAPTFYINDHLSDNDEQGPDNTCDSDASTDESESEEEQVQVKHKKTQPVKQTKTKTVKKYVPVIVPKQQTHCPDFLYKWSWDFGVMQIHCHEHKREEYKQFTSLATYVVSLIQ